MIRETKVGLFILFGLFDIVIYSGCWSNSYGKHNQQESYAIWSLNEIYKAQDKHLASISKDGECADFLELKKYISSGDIELSPILFESASNYQTSKMDYSFSLFILGLNCEINKAELSKYKNKIWWCYAWPNKLAKSRKTYLLMMDGKIYYSEDNMVNSCPKPYLAVEIFINNNIIELKSKWNEIEQKEYRIFK